MNNQSVVTRLNRIKGQIEGVSKMIETEKSCMDVITQMKATKSALESAMHVYLEAYAHECMQKKDTKNLEVILKEITKQ